MSNWKKTTAVPEFSMSLAGISPTSDTGVHVREHFGDWKMGTAGWTGGFGLMSSLFLPRYFQKDTCLEVVSKQINEGSKKPYLWRRLMI